MSSRKKQPVYVGSEAAQIATTDLFAFNCSYFKDCAQCLSPKLGGSCVWCASNSKCIFAKQKVERISYLASSLASLNENECPNEIEFYKVGGQSTSLCTSYSLTNTQSPKIEVAYSGDSNLSILLRNPRSDYQTSFKCVFTKNKAVNPKFKVYATNLVKDTRSVLINKSGPVEGLMQSNDSSQVKYVCKYSPYTDLNQVDSGKALQNVYLSVWWSSGFGGLIDDGLTNLAGWNQVQFKRENNDER